jgi:hypothetical protein
MEDRLRELTLFALIGLALSVLVVWINAGCSGVSIPQGPDADMIEVIGGAIDNRDKPDEPLQDEFGGAVLHTCPPSVALWPVVSSLTVEIRGSKLFLATDKPELWPNVDGCIGNIHCLLFRESRWHAGPIDGMRPFAQNGGDRGKGCGAVPDGDKRLYEAIPGEQVGFVVTGFCRKGARMQPVQRTAIGWVTWK